MELVITKGTAMVWKCYEASQPQESEHWATSDRGWLFDTEGSPLGNYLDYGPDHYRSPHEYCHPGECKCWQSQPGNVHAIAHDRGSRYCKSVEHAKRWIEQQVTGQQS